MEHNLAYWKGRKVDMRNWIAAADPLCSYHRQLWRDYRFATRKVEQFEGRQLIRHKLKG